MNQLALNIRWQQLFVYEMKRAYRSLFSKKQNENIWPDQVGPKPDFKKVDWNNKSDSILAAELCDRVGDSKRGPGSTHNRLKKIFNDKRKLFQK